MSILNTYLRVFFFYFELSLFFCLFTWSVCKPNNLWKLHDVFKTTSNSRKEKKKKLNKFLRSSLVSFFIVFSNFFFLFLNSTWRMKIFFCVFFTSHCCWELLFYFCFRVSLRSLWKLSVWGTLFFHSFFFMPTKRWKIWFKEKVKLRDKKVFHFTFQFF